jgi:hypothetical protein
MKIKTKNILLRLFYIIPFLLFAYALIEELFLVDERFRRVDYVVIISTTIFLYQSIRNSIIGWILAMILYLIFLYMLGEGIVRSINYLGGKIDLRTFIIQCGLVLIYLGLGFLYWKIRPRKRII